MKHLGDITKINGSYMSRKARQKNRAKRLPVRRKAGAMWRMTKWRKDNERF